MPDAAKIIAEALGRWGHLTVHLDTPEAVAGNESMLNARAKYIAAALRDAGMLTETGWEYAQSEVRDDGTTAFGNPVASLEEAIRRRDIDRAAWPWPEELGVGRRRKPGPWEPVPPEEGN